MRKPFVASGLGFLAVAGLWQFAFAGRWTQRLPPGWSASQRYVGTMTYADPRTGRLPDKDHLVVYERVQRIASDAGRPDSVVLEDRFTVRDIETDSVTWEYVTRYTVNPRTGEHSSAPHAGEIGVFPRHVQRTTYRLRTNYVEGIPLTFVEVVDLDGLAAYHFRYRGAAEYTKSYAGTAQYAGVQVPPGRAIRCADDRFSYDVWIEPNTGELVKLEEGCRSGDYVYEIAGGTRLGAVSRWDGVTAGDALIERINAVRGLRTGYLWASRYVTVVLLAMAAVLLGLSRARRAMRATP